MSDYHTERAAKHFGVKPEDVTREQRASVKLRSFAELYGHTPEQIRNWASLYGKGYKQIELTSPQLVQVDCALLEARCLQFAMLQVTTNASAILGKHEIAMLGSIPSWIAEVRQVGNCFRHSRGRLKLVVCGSREGEPKLVKHVLEALHGRGNIEILACGDATGIDSHANEWAKRIGLQRSVWPAPWHNEDPSAGPRRNAAMLKTVNPHLVLAMPGGKGTADCVKQAKELGIPVLEVTCA